MAGTETIQDEMATILETTETGTATIMDLDSSISKVQNEDFKTDTIILDLVVREIQIIASIILTDLTIHSATATITTTTTMTIITV
jgi:hypothetical protein